MSESGESSRAPSVDAIKSPDPKELRKEAEVRLLDKLLKESLRTNVVPILRDLLHNDDVFKNFQKPVLELGIPSDLNNDGRRVKLLFDAEPVILGNEKDLLLSAPRGEMKNQYRSKQILITFDADRKPVVHYSARVALTERTASYSTHSFADENDVIVDYEKKIPSVTAWDNVLNDPEFHPWLVTEGTDGIDDSLYDQIRYAGIQATPRLDGRQLEFKRNKLILQGSSDKGYVTRRINT